MNEDEVTPTRMRVGVRVPRYATQLFLVLVGATLSLDVLFPSPDMRVATTPRVSITGTSHTPMPLRKSNSPAAQAFAVAGRVLRTAEDLVATGGIYIYDTDTLLYEAHAQPHFFLSGQPVDEWLSWQKNWNYMYSLELTLVRMLQASPFVTTNPETAALFFVPQYSLHETHVCFFKHMVDLKVCGAKVVREYLLPLITAVKAGRWYQRRHGRDHLFVFPHDFAWGFFPGIAEALANSSYWGQHDENGSAVIVPTPIDLAWGPEETMRNLYRGGGTPENFDTRLRHPAVSDVREPCAGGPAMRPHLAVFLGSITDEHRYSQGIRQALKAAFGVKQQHIHIVVDGPLSTEGHRSVLRDSTFCLCPQGYAPWSPRIFHAISTGCIPVVFEKPGFDMLLPFEGLGVNWSSFTIRIPADDVSKTADVLEAIPLTRVCEMRAALVHWAPALLWTSSPTQTFLFAVAAAWEQLKGKDQRGH